MDIGVAPLKLLVFLCICSSMQITRGIVTLRPKNERVAWDSGVECLESVQRMFHNLRMALEDTEEGQNLPGVAPATRNIIALHMQNLTSPAAEIERNYLKRINHLISSGVFHSQLRVVSDNYPIDGLTNVAFNVLSTPDFYVLVTDDFDKLLVAIQNTLKRASSWNPAAKFLILFNNIEHRQRLGRKTVTGAFQEIALRHHVNHICLLFATSGGQYDVYVSKLFRKSDEGKCVPMSSEKVTTCADGRFSDEEEFSQQLQKAAVPRNMPQCTFTACASTSQPFVAASCRGGLEITLIRYIANYLNFNLSVSCSKKPRGEIEEDGTLTHLLKDLRDDKCDFIVGSMYPDNDVHLLFRSTLPYYEDQYTWFVPLAPKRAAWKGLAYIFEFPTWAFIGFVLLLSAFVWNFIAVVSQDRRKFRRFSMCLLNNWATLLCHSVPLQPLKTSLRLLFMGIALYSLNMTTIYTSNLVAVFTQPAYDAQLASIEEILESGLPLGGREEYQDWFHTDYPIDQHIARVYNLTDDFQPSTENLDKVRQGHRALLLSRWFVISRNYSKKVFGLPANVFQNQMEMIFEKGFPLVNLFDKAINRVKDNGIIYKIEGDWRARMEKNNAIGDGQSEIILTVQHLEGAFAILAYGLFFAVVVFALEMLFSSKFRVAVWKIKLIYGYYLTIKFPCLK